jgi:hypothetical protein
MAGKAESYLLGLMRPLTAKGWWLKKNTDWNVIFGSKEEGVDYVLAMASLQIEVKNSNKDGALIDEPTKVQRDLLNKYGGYIFLVMWDEGYPRLPKGGDGYLVPWPAYQDFMEATSLQRKSVRRHKGFRAYGADEYLEDYRLEWEDGHFHIPPHHPFWDEIIARADKLQAQVESIKAWRASARQGDGRYVDKVREQTVQPRPGRVYQSRQHGSNDYVRKSRGHYKGKGPHRGSSSPHRNR